MNWLKADAHHFIGVVEDIDEKGNATFVKLAEFTEDLKKPEKKGLVVLGKGKNNNEKIAFATLEESEKGFKYSYLRRLIMRKDLQGKKLGKLVLGALIEYWSDNVGDPKEERTLEFEIGTFVKDWERIFWIISMDFKFVNFAFHPGKALIAIPPGIRFPYEDKSVDISKWRWADRLLPTMTAIFKPEPKKDEKTE